MNEDQKDLDQSQNDQNYTETQFEETVVDDTVDDQKDLKSALAQKDHYRAKAKQLEAELKTREEELARTKSERVQSQGLDVTDYIDISASLQGLDQREQEYLAREHKLTGKPLSEIRQSEDFQFWQQAYRQKVEKDRKTLTPSSVQDEVDRPKSFEQKLAEAKTIKEKEDLLRSVGMYKENRPRDDRTTIGRPIAG